MLVFFSSSEIFFTPWISDCPTSQIQGTSNNYSHAWRMASCQEMLGFTEYLPWPGWSGCPGDRQGACSPLATLAPQNWSRETTHAQWRLQGCQGNLQQATTQLSWILTTTACSTCFQSISGSNTKSTNDAVPWKDSKINFVLQRIKEGWWRWM